MIRFLLGIFSVFCLAMPVEAQITFGESDAPILVAADKATYKGKVTILETNVDVRQGDARILADYMEIYRESSGDEAVKGLSLGAVTRIVAKGNFSYTTPENVVTGDQGVYVRQTGRITVTGNVTARQPSGSRLSGERLVYDIASKRTRFGEDCSGDDCSRVSIRIE